MGLSRNAAILAVLPFALGACLEPAAGVHSIHKKDVAARTDTAPLRTRPAAPPVDRDGIPAQLDAASALVLKGGFVAYRSADDCRAWYAVPPVFTLKATQQPERYALERPELPVEATLPACEDGSRPELKPMPFSLDTLSLDTAPDQPDVAEARLVAAADGSLELQTAQTPEKLKLEARLTLPTLTGALTLTRPVRGGTLTGE